MGIGAGVDIGIAMRIGGPPGMGMGAAAAAVAAAICISLHRAMATSAHHPRSSRGAMHAQQLPEGRRHLA